MNKENMPWYRVPEVWLILFLLAAAVIGSIATLITALRHPDLPNSIVLISVEQNDST